MKRNLPILLIVIAIVAVAAMRGRKASDNAAEGKPDSAQSRRLVGVRFSGNTVNQVARSQYRLEYQRSVKMGERVMDETVLRAKLAVEPLSRDGRVEISVADVTITGGQRGPKADELGAMQVGTDDGRIVGAGFAADTGGAAKDMMINLATAIWFVRGQGAEWTVDEQDVTGRFNSTYRDAAGVVTRTRRYTALRKGKRWDRRGAEAIVTDGQTAFSVDSDGVSSINGSEVIHLAVGKTGTVIAKTRVTLTRTDVQWVSPRAGADFVIEPLRMHNVLTEADKDRAMMKNWTTDKLIAQFASLAKLKHRSEKEQQWRGGMLLHLRALARVKDGGAKRLADELLANKDGDQRKTSLIAGALGAANTPEATQALVDIMNSDVHATAKPNVAAALGTTTAPSQESMAALIKAMDDKDYRSTAALALGSQANKLNDGDAIDLLISKFNASTDRNEKSTYLHALGNAGNRKALELMRETINGSDLALSAVAAYCVRKMPGDDIDVLLQGIIGGTGALTVRIHAIRGVASRSSTLWQPILTALNETAEGELKDAINGVLGAW